VGEKAKKKASPTVPVGGDHSPTLLSTARNGDTLNLTDNGEFVVVGHRPPKSRQGRWRDPLVRTAQTASSFLKRRPDSDRYYSLLGGGFQPKYGLRSLADLRAMQFGGLVVTGKDPGQDNPNLRNIHPANPFAINGHAVVGDGSPREADFRDVSLDDLGGSLRKEALIKGSPFGLAIAQAARTGAPVPVAISDIVGGRTVFRSGAPFAQQVGIGRFSTDVFGKVEVDGENWRLQADVTGRPDEQDYPPDPRRSAAAEWGTRTLGDFQQQLGGQNYGITFFGKQRIHAMGRR